MSVDLPLPPPTLVITNSAYHRALLGTYFQDGEKVASSRTTPADLPSYPLGTWRVDDTFHGQYGHDLSVLLELPVDELEPGEFDWKDPERTFDRGKLPDVARYQEWLGSGLQAPPLEVVEAFPSRTRPAGVLRVTDGHRRLLAAERQGRTEVRAWLSPLAPHPEGLRDLQGNDMLAPLTWETATGRPWNAEALLLAPNRRPTHQKLQRAADGP